MSNEHVPTQTVVVDLSAVRGVPAYKASGFIWCFTPDGMRPSDAIVAPLKIQKTRCSPARIRSWYPRLRALNMRAQMVISDGWRDLTGNARWPGDNDAWDEWERFCTDLVRSNQIAGITTEYDIVNEPDNKGFWTPTYERFLEAWKRGYRAIRSVDPPSIRD